MKVCPNCEGNKWVRLTNMSYYDVCPECEGTGVKRKEYKMKIRNLTKEQLEDIAGKIDNEGFWYGFAHWGLKPEELLEEQEDIDRVNEAINTLKEFEELCPQL